MTQLISVEVRPSKSAYLKHRYLVEDEHLKARFLEDHPQFIGYDIKFKAAEVEVIEYLTEEEYRKEILS